MRRYLGRGKQTTSITMTVFYLLLWYAAKNLATIASTVGLDRVVIVLAVLRILLCLLPQNRWADRYPPVNGGAYGTFTVTHDISKYTRAAVLQPGALTETFPRFSTVAGERGAADCERDIRGVATKFYTSEGNWDLVGNNNTAHSR